MNLEELWIGDILRLKTSGRVGKFEGINPVGKARINVDGKIYLAKAHQLEVLDNHEIESLTQQKEEAFQSQFKVPKPKLVQLKEINGHTIDLHINKLNPSLETNRAERILDYQMKAFESFLRKSIHAKKQSIKVIHGKGTGVLKMEVMNILKYHPQVLQTFPTNNGGAVEIIFTYS